MPEDATVWDQMQRLKRSLLGDWAIAGAVTRGVIELLVRAKPYGSSAERREMMTTCGVLFSRRGWNNRVPPTITRCQAFFA